MRRLVLVWSFVALAPNVSAIDPASQFWIDRGGVESWCDVAYTLQQNSLEYPQIQMAVIDKALIVDGQVVWRMRMDPSGRAKFQGPVPEKERSLWLKIVALFVAACL